MAEGTHSAVLTLTKLRAHDLVALTQTLFIDKAAQLSFKT
jgi:hypothetical protein